MALLALGAVTLAACGESATPTVPPPPPTATTATGGDPATGGTVNTAGQPEHITVQHILIGFKDAVGFQGNAPPAAQARTEE